MVLPLFILCYFSLLIILILTYLLTYFLIFNCINYLVSLNSLDLIPINFKLINCFKNIHFFIIYFSIFINVLLIVLNLYVFVALIILIAV